MAEDHLLNAAGRIADGDVIDWGSITSTLNSAHDLAIAEELALVQQIADGHRQLHQLLPAAADTPPHLMPDRARWGHLDLLNVVGRGAYGIVYRAWDTRLDRLVALKLFHGACDPDQVMQEGRMLARVRHENVVTIYGADMLDGVAGIWMELVHGKTLDDIVKGSGPLPAREAAAVGADVARALGAIHAAGLLHCDVKAHNVVWETGGRVVLMDLGAGRLAPEARDGDHIPDVAGTPRYMAPELFISANATRASDIYSLGVLMYFLVSGKYPVEGNTLGELRRAHDRGTIRPLASQRPGFPDALIEVVTRAIDRDPAQRPSAAVDMQSALAAIAAAPHVEPARRAPAAWWLAAAGAVALLAIVLLQPLLTRPAALPPLQSIAVMPIQNLTGDPAKQYLADGFTEVLTAHLARLPGLTVASLATMATQRGTGGGDLALAEKLGVRLLLAGSVVQADDRIALSIKLTDPREGRTIWGSELEREPATILDARSEIARLVAARLSLAFPAALRADDSRQLLAEAQDAFLRGLAAASNGSAPNALAAIGLFSRAVQLEPTWADPLAHLALVEQRAIEFGDPALRQSRAQDVRAHAMRAIELDPSVPMSYTALAAIQAYHDRDFVAAEATLRQAIDTSPVDSSAQGRLALLLAAAGRQDEALAEARAARDREPLVPERHTNLGMIRYYARDFNAALAEMDRALAIAPNYALGHHGRGRVLAALGRYDEAINSIQQALAVSDNAGWWATLGVTYAKAGRLRELESVLQRLREFEQRGTFVSVDQYAYIAAHQGRLDEAFGLLEKAVDLRMTNVLWLAVDPRADVMREDPRFARLIARMGLVAR